MKKTPVKKAPAKKAPVKKPSLLVELTKRKMEAQKNGETSEGFGKFKPNKTRADNRLNVGPSWGPRKGN